MPDCDRERLIVLATEAFIGATVGASVASAAGATADRWSTGATLVTPWRSVCGACGRRLACRDLVPIASWIMLRGRCRGCHAPIPVRLLLLEVGGAGVGTLILMRYGVSEFGALLGLVAGALIVATLSDLASRRIPHRLTIPLGAVTLPTALLLREGVSAPTILLWALGLPALLGALNGILRPLLRADAIGGGDIRLLVAVLASVSLLPGSALTFLLSLIATSGGIALIGLLSGRLKRRDRIPLAPFMLLAFLIAVLGGSR